MNINHLLNFTRTTLRRMINLCETPCPDLAGNIGAVSDETGIAHVYWHHHGYRRNRGTGTTW